MARLTKEQMERILSGGGLLVEHIRLAEPNEPAASYAANQEATIRKLASDLYSAMVKLSEVERDVRKEREAIAKELREMAGGPAVMCAGVAQFRAVMLGTRILELANRIEKGKVV